MGCSAGKFSRQIQPRKTPSKKQGDAHVYSIYQQLFEEILGKFDEKDRNHLISYCSELLLDDGDEQVRRREDDGEIARLKEHLRREIADENPLISLGRLMMEIGSFDRAEYFYLKALTNEDPTNWIRCSAIYNNLGKIHHEELHLEKALAFYQKSLQIQCEHLDESHRYLTADYSNIGSIYHQMNDLDKAVEYMHKSLNIQLNLSHPNEELLASLFTNIGLIYNDQKKYAEALIYHQKSLQMNEKSHPSLHPSIALSHHNLSISLFSLNLLNESLEHIDRAIQISSSSLPSTHPQALLHQQLKNEIVKKLPR